MPRVRWPAAAAARRRVMILRARVMVRGARSSFLFNPARTRFDPAAAAVRYRHRCAGNSIVTRLFEFSRRALRDNGAA
jgi:hypothetical protein